MISFRGSTATLNGEYRFDSGVLVDPVSPLVDILSPSAAVVVSNATPVRDSEGLYHYDFTVPSDAALGTWTARWTGTILGTPVSGDDQFTVEAAAATPVPAIAPVRTLARWVNEADLIDVPTLTNVRLPSGVTLDDCCAAATDYLWRASAARYDAHEVTIRPSRLVSGCVHALDPSQWLATYALPESDWVREINLEGPATNVSVIVDGIALAESEFLVVDGHRLVRIGQAFPCCQDLSLPNGSPGTWSVTYTVGILPPPLGRMAARQLATELALFHSGKPSKLPAGTTRVTRSGISVDLQQPKRSSGGDPGTTGLPIVELFLDSVNPRRRQQAPLVLSPDVLTEGRIS